MQMIDWLHEHFNTVPITPVLAKRAIRHLKKREKGKLFSEDLSQMRAAEGRWYEGLIYELVLTISEKTEFISGVVRKGADAPFPPPEVVLGQNGLFYSNRGDLQIRGNGQDLAEIDLLIMDHKGQIAFAEVVTSPSDLKTLEDEVAYKKRLLGYLYGQVHVPFILFSSVDISRTTVIRRVVSQPDSTLIVTSTCTDIKTMLRSSDIRGKPRKPIRHPKLMPLESALQRRAFDYKALHDLRREKVVANVRKLRGNAVHKPDEIPPIVKKILLGALYPSAYRELAGADGILIKDRRYSAEELGREFSKLILAVNLPGYDPLMYFRIPDRQEYLKLVPKKTGGWRIDSKRTPRMRGFFLWLESVQPSVDAGLTRGFMRLNGNGR
jgi:hypothetical protein